MDEEEGVSLADVYGDTGAEMPEGDLVLMENPMHAGGGGSGGAGGAGSDEGKERWVLDLRKQLEAAEEQRDRQTGLVEQPWGENEELRSRIQQLELAGAAGAGKEGVTL